MSGNKTGYGSMGTRAGDVICQVEGCEIAIVLRRMP